MALFSKKTQPTVAMEPALQQCLQENLKPILRSRFALEGLTTLVFLGNGAEAYRAENAPHYLRLRGQGKFRMMAAYSTAIPDRIALENPFEQEGAVFAGFTCRKNIDGVWKWFSAGCNWCRPAADLKKHYFQVGETLEEIDMRPGEVLFFDAVWKDKAGNILDYGHTVFRRLLARSMGGYWGKTRLNTKMAFHNAIQNDFHFFEVDFRLTTVDKYPVCSYGWNKKACQLTGMVYDPAFEKMNRELFLRQRIDGMVLMDADILLRHMREHPDFYLCLNLHAASPERCAVLLKNIINAFREDESVLDRCVVEIDSPELYEALRKIYPFEHWIYMMKDEYYEIDKVLQFCVDQGITCMAMDEFIAEPEQVQKIRCAGVLVAAHTIDGLNAARRLLHSGVNTIFTNFLSPAVMDEPQKGVRVTYNSAPGAIEDISPMLERGLLASNSTLTQTQKGAWEYTVLGAVGLHKPYRLMTCCYRMEGHVFQGWAMRTLTREKKWKWLCANGDWYSKARIQKSNRLELQLFEDRGQIPMEIFPRSNKVWLVAQWITEEELERQKSAKAAAQKAEEPEDA